MHCAWFEDLMHRERKYLTKLVSCLQDIPSDSNTLSCFCYACTRLSMPVCLSVTRRYWVKTDNHRIALGRSRYCQFFETRFNTRRHRETPLATASYPTSQGNTPCNGFIPEVTGKHPLQRLRTRGHRETPLLTVVTVKSPYTPSVLLAFRLLPPIDHMQTLTLSVNIKPVSKWSSCHICGQWHTCNR